MKSQAGQIETKSASRDAFRQQHCLMPLDDFHGGKRPW
jgi:hypothetical protein